MQKILPTSQFFRFLIVGVINSIFGFGVFCAAILLGANNFGGVLAGNLAGLIFNLFTTGSWVFRSMSYAIAARFVICYLFLLGINTLILHVLSADLSRSMLTQAVLTLPLAALSYVLMSRWVFKVKQISNS